MTEMWYYTTEGKQMDPVTITELQRLASVGTLKPTDMVWKDGLPRWVRASTMKELFPDSPVNSQFTYASGTDQSSSPASPQAHAAAMQPAGAVPMAYDDDPQYPRRRRVSGVSDSPASGRSRPNAQSGGGIGIIAALLLGVLLLVGGLGVGLIILLTSSQGGGGGKVNPENLIKGEAKYNLVLAPNARDSRNFSFKRGVDYLITVKTKPELQELDVDLHIFNANGQEVISDTDPDRDCRLRWIPDADGEYRVEIVNLNQFGRAVQVNCAASIREFTEDLVAERKDPPKDEPLPADTLEGKGFKDFTIPMTTKEEVQKFRIKVRHKVTLTYVPANANAKTNFDIVVVKDSEPNSKIAEDVGADARATVSFIAEKTEIVRVRIINASGKGGGPGKGVLNYDVSP